MKKSLINESSSKKFVNYFFWFLPIIFFLNENLVTLAIVLMTILMVYDFFKYNKKIYLYPFDYFLITFFVYVFISNLFFDNLNNRLLNLLFFSLFFIFSSSYINFDTIKKKKFYNFYLFFIIFIIIDSFIQFFFKKNLLGYGLALDLRVTSFFGEEAILGHFLQWITVPIIIFFFLKKNNLKAFFLFSFILLTIILTVEKISIIFFIFNFILILIFLRKIKYFLLLFLSLILFTFIIHTNKHLELHKKNLYGLFSSLGLSNSIISKYNPRFIEDKTFYNELIINKTSKEIYLSERIKELMANNKISIGRVNDILKRFGQKKQENYKRIDILDNFHGSIFFNTFLQIKENLFFGYGIKKFRFNCENFKREIVIKGNSYKLFCSTHPHNFYLEIFYETGLIGLILFMLFILNFGYIFFKKKLKKNKTVYLVMIGISCQILFISIFFPIKSTGSFFSSIYSFHILYIISIMRSYILR